MTRAAVEILEDDEEADVASFMLNACGLEFRVFYFNERVLTKENFEKNYDVLVKMVETRSDRRAPYFVFGYFTLLTGGKISEKLRQDILEAAKWEHEEGYWLEEDFALKRKIYLKDFREKIRMHKSGQKLHPARFKYYGQDFLNFNVVVGVKQFRDFYESGRFNGIQHVNLDGWGLKSIPPEIFNIKNLKSLSVEFNQITEVPDEISNSVSLKYLFLGYNYLKTLPEAIGKLPSLKSLNVIHNDIYDLPKSIKDLKKLKYIYVRGTKITKVPMFLKTAKLDDLNQTISL